MVTYATPRILGRYHMPSYFLCIVCFYPILVITNTPLGLSLYVSPAALCHSHPPRSIPHPFLLYYPFLLYLPNVD